MRHVTASNAVLCCVLPAFAPLIMDKGVELKDQITADAVAGVVGNRPVYTKPEDRKCRDLLFLILFAVFWVGMLAIGGVGIALGEPAR